MDGTEMVDMHGNRTKRDAGLEYYSTKEPKIIEVRKSTTYDFTVERITPPSSGR